MAKETPSVAHFLFSAEFSVSYSLSEKDSPSERRHLIENQTALCRQDAGAPRKYLSENSNI
ncbi:MAG: hypothetical protein HY774_28280 [Acidobacteria bacterium]|nr:hypothetical protein [Acidobacteriota bacterium]